MEMTQQMVGTTICVLSDSVAAPVQSSIEKFRDEYMSLIWRWIGRRGGGGVTVSIPHRRALLSAVRWPDV